MEKKSTNDFMEIWKRKPKTKLNKTNQTQTKINQSKNKSTMLENLINQISEISRNFQCC